MKLEKSNNLDEELNISQEVRDKKAYFKRLVIYLLKRFFSYMIFLHVIITIIFLIQLFSAEYPQNIFEFYLSFSIILFILYGCLILAYHFLSKSYLNSIFKKSKDLSLTREELEITENLLQGKTLQIYWYIYTHNNAGIREIQKALKISSSGTVAYQITKLLNSGIISKDKKEGKYTINKEVKIGILKFFIRIGTKVIPRISLYLIIYILGFIAYSILAAIQGEEFILEPLSLFLLLFLIFGTIIFIYESFKIWKLNPVKK